MPVLANLETDNGMVEGDGPFLIDSDVSVSDAEQDWDGGYLIVSGILDDDIVSLLDGGQITLDVNDIIFGGQVIGAWSIGLDGEFIVTFNANADNAGVEAVIESLQFANNSDNPEYVRTLTFELVDAAGNAASVGSALFPQTGAADPFHGVDFGSTARIAFGDIDADGDLDAIVAVYGDGFHLFRNNGTASAPDFTEEVGGVSFIGNASGNVAGITMLDYNGDGWSDIVLGRYDGTLQLFLGDFAENFYEQPGVFAGIDVYGGASPGLADLNGDSFLDIVIARGGGRFDYFTGGPGGYTEQTGAANPLSGFINYGGAQSVSFADIDGDGDFDFIAGNGEGYASLFVNTGTASAPSFTRSYTTFYSQGVGGGSQPVFLDIDNDGDLDVAVGYQDGTVQVLLQAPASPSIDIFVDGVDDPATGVADDTASASASDPTTGNLLTGVSDPDNTVAIIGATVNGDPIPIDDPVTLADGTRIQINADGSYTITPGLAARNLGASGSGASNTSLQYVVAYTLGGGESAQTTFTISGIDDKDVLTGTIGFDIIQAGVGNDVVFGLAGIDYLYGEDGNDTLYGDDGDDSLYGGAGADKLWGGDGTDTLFSDAGAGYLYGEAGVDYLNGGDDNDYLDGGSGDDYLAGGAGNDVYIVDSVGDAVTEGANAGYDIIRSTVSIDVLVDNVEAIQLQGSADLYATGNDAANNLQGNSGDNILSGYGGVDTINGNDGDDIIAGGTGNDLLRGGMGADTFIVFQESVGTPVLETDTIYDFNSAEGDILNLQNIDANSRMAGDQSFRVVSAFTKYDAAHPELTGQMTLTFAGGITTVRLDVNGDAKVDYQIKINGDVTGDWGGWIL